MTLTFGHWCSYHIFISVIFREIRQRRRWRHRDLKKIVRFSEQNSAVGHTCGYISLRSLNDRDMKFPNSMFYVGQKHKTMVFSFFLNLDMVLENSVPEKFAYCWRINRNGIFAMNSLCQYSFRCCRRRGCVIFVKTEKSPGKMEYWLFYALFLCN